MIEKMKYINMMGRIVDIDRVIDEYIAKYDIQLEYATKELPNAHLVSAFDVHNPYTDIYRKAEKFAKMTDLEDDVGLTLSTEGAIAIIEKAYDFFVKREAIVHELEAHRDSIKEFMSNFDPFTGLDFEVENLEKFKYIKFRFGKMPINSFRQFEAFIYDDAEILFLNGKQDADYMWCVYFVPERHKDKIDSVMQSLHFERFWFSYEFEGNKYKGTPKEVYNQLNDQLVEVNARIKAANKKILSDVDLKEEEIIAAYDKIKQLHFYYDTRKYAAKTENDFYVFVGWMTKKDTASLTKLLEEDKRIVFIIEEDNESLLSKAPTMLKNFPLFKPFEFFVKMYGVPSYNEIDPTPFVALTYSVLFGIMFGDIGQGGLLALLGLYLNKKKHMMLGSIMSVIGIFSMFFGLMYGSVFGFEELIQAVWDKPSANINTVLIATVVFGIGLIFIAMILNIINSILAKDWGRLFFDPNGLCGIIFYGSIIATALMIFSGGSPLPIVLILIPLVLIAFREPLTYMVLRKKFAIHGGLVQYALETVIELFEVLLSYFTNTVSFVRVGAFALSHAGMMHVVMMLSGYEHGNGNILVVIIGNMIVIALEGLIVGIQVLRLEFYEMFSRFYDGNGKEFISYKKSLDK